MVTAPVWTYAGPESSWILGAAICDNGVWDSAYANTVFKGQPGQLWPVNILLAWYVDCHFRQLVHDNENGTVVQCCSVTQICEVLDRNTLPLVWCCNHEHVDHISRMLRFIDSVAFFASANVLTYVLVGCLPVIILKYRLSRLKTSKMTGLQIVME